MLLNTTYTRPLSVQAQYSKSCPIISSSCYNSILVTWTVVCLTAAMFKHLIFPMSGFALSSFANICIFMILYLGTNLVENTVPLLRSHLLVCPRDHYTNTASQRLLFTEPIFSRNCYMIAYVAFVASQRVYMPQYFRTIFLLYPGLEKVLPIRILQNKIVLCIFHLESSSYISSPSLPWWFQGCNIIWQRAKFMKLLVI
jgi:hypothetical protein